MALAERAELVARLSLDDRFSGKARGVLGSLGKMEGTFSKIGAHAQRGLSQAATNLTRIGVAAGVFIAGNVAQGVRSLENLERVTNATAGVIESTGSAAGVTAQQVRNMAQELEALTTADDKAIQEGENMLLTFTSIGKDVFPQATKAVTNLAIAMADGNVENADFSRTAIQVGKALNDPIRGITALRRVGVQFTEQQEKQIKKLVESGKTVEAQRLILAELEKEFGKAGEAAGKGFGADMRRFQDAVEDAQQALARGLLPVISRVSQWLTTKLAEPGTMRAIEDFGRSLAGTFDKLVAAGGKIPWQQIGDSMKLAGQGAKAALDLFVGMPAWVQTAVLTGWGLNKLTGGALGSIVGELGKGLVKGVLGMTAGVVNLRAGTVVGAGLGGAGGAAGAATGGAAYRAGTVIGNVMKVFGVIAIAELADEFHDEISGLGSELGKKIPFLLAERLALGKSISELYWPFGPKGAPSWAGGTGTFGDSTHLMGTHDRVSRAPAPGTPITRTGAGSTQTAEEQRSAINWDKIKTNTDKTNTRLSALETRIRESRVAQVVGSERTRSAINVARINQVAATRTGDAAIVAAIRANRPVIKLSVTSNTFIRAAQTSGVYTAAHVGAYNKAGSLI